MACMTLQYPECINNSTKKPFFHCMNKSTHNEIIPSHI